MRTTEAEGRVTVKPGGSSGKVVRIPRDARAFVEPIEPFHIFAPKVEVEDLGVLADALGPHGFRDDDEIVLEAPTDQNLCGRAAVVRRDLLQDRVAEPPSPRERTV